jgi:hypothetical protein
MALHQSKIFRALGGDMRLLETFCERMDANAAARELADWITGHAKDGASLPISDQNVTDFRQGYFARWKERQASLQRTREQIAAAQRLVRENGEEGASTLQQAAAAKAACIISEVLEAFDPDTLKAQLEEDPSGFNALAKSIQSLSGADLGYRQYKQRCTELEQKLRIERESHAEALRLTRERVATLEQARKSAKENLKANLAALQKAARAGTLNTKDNSALMAAIVATIDAM